MSAPVTEPDGDAVVVAAVGTRIVVHRHHHRLDGGRARVAASALRTQGAVLLAHRHPRIELGPGGVASPRPLNSVPVGLLRMDPPAIAGNVGVVTNFVLSVIPLGLSRGFAGTFGAITGGAAVFMARFHRGGRLYAVALQTPATLALGFAAPMVCAQALLDHGALRYTASLAAALIVAAPYAVLYWLLACRAAELPGGLAYGLVARLLPRRSSRGRRVRHASKERCR